MHLRQKVPLVRPDTLPPLDILRLPDSLLQTRLHSLLRITVLPLVPKLMMKSLTLMKKTAGIKQILMILTLSSWIKSGSSFGSSTGSSTGRLNWLLSFLTAFVFTIGGSSSI